MKTVKFIIKYLASIFIYPFCKLRDIEIIEDGDTIDLLKNGYSLGRYGDGEFMLMMDQSIGFQKKNPTLKLKLQSILNSTSTDNKFLLGVPKPLINTKGFLFDTAIFWKWYVVKNSKNLKNLLGNRRFANASITRPYMDYKKSNYEIFDERFKNLKRIWDKKNILIVEGEFTKLGVGNDLFDNCHSIKRIVCPSKDAYDVYDKIYDMVKEKHKNELVLIALGPTATILAFDLSQNEQIQCIDIGHIDVEYLWYLNKATSKEAIIGKSVNEVSHNSPNNDCDKKDEVYLSQIIAVIK